MGSFTLNLADEGELPDGRYVAEVTRVLLQDKMDGTNQYLRADLVALA